MKLFENLDVSGVEKTEDYVGGFSSLLDSDIYVMKIKTAYATTSKGGAMGVTFVGDINGNEYSETLYITNKNKEPYYIDAQHKKRFIPGYNVVNNICLVAAGKGITDLETEDKVLNVYSFEEKKRVPTSVPVLVDLSGKEVALGIVKELSNKAVADGKGGYVPTSETRESNITVAVFYPDNHKSVNEQVEGKEATFWDKWLEKNQGKTVDRRKFKEGNSPTLTPVSAPTPQPRKSLFEK